MGFSYTHFGLCCDFCGHSEPSYNVKKIACPYGYCQAWACCKFCKAKKLHLVCSIGNTRLPHKEICKIAMEKIMNGTDEKSLYIRKVMEVNK